MPKPGPFDPAPTAPAGTAPARREFLKAGAAAAGATLLSSCVGGGGGDSPLPMLGAPQIDPLSRFDHLVVLMFENRSFDNLLGYLYPPGSVTYPAGSTFSGLAGGTLRQSGAALHPRWPHERHRAPESGSRGRHDASRPGSGGALPARQHPALRPCRPALERVRVHGEDARALQRADEGPAADDAGLRARLLQQLHAHAEAPAHLRRVPGHHGLVRTRLVTRAVDARPLVRRLRRVVLRGAVADLLQPVVLSCLDLLGPCGQRARAQVDEERRAHDLQPARRKPGAPGACTATARTR